MVTKSSNPNYITPIRSSGSTAGALEEAGRAEQHITEAAPNQLKLGEGAYSDEWAIGNVVASGVFVRRHCENHLVSSEFLSESGHTLRFERRGS